MSTVLCILSTEDEPKRGVLRHRLSKLQEGGIGASFVSIKVLQPIDNDPFLSGRDRVFSNLVAIVKFIAPLGVAMSDYADDVVAAIADINKGVGAACYVCVTSRREFKKTGDESVDYLYFMKRRAGFSSADYLDYYTNSHFNFGMQTNGITNIQNYVDTPASMRIAERLGASPADFDSVSEMLFSSIDDFFASNDVDDLGERATMDEMKFVDRESSEMICCEEFAG